MIVPNSVDHRIGLATRITGIVFWGLMLMGLGLVFLLLRNMENIEAVRYQSQADRLELKVQEVVLQKPPLSDATLGERLNAFRLELGVVATELHMRGTTLTSGRPYPGLNSTQRPIMLATGNTASLTIYYPDPRDVIKARRKTIILTMGGAFMAFGFILQWILQRVLTQPFLRMVETAKAISHDTKERRFDEGRNDEFGFLAKFINRSLEFRDRQTRELQSALDQIRKSEAELSKSTAEWTYAMDFIDDPLCLVNLDDEVVRANRAFYQFTGRTSETTIGRTLTSVMHPQGEITPCPVCQVRSDRRDAYIIREPDDPTNRTGRPMEVMVRMILDAAGQPTGMLVGIRDLTRTRQTEEALRLRNRAIEASVNAIVITNFTKPDNPIEYVNPAFERITGYTAAEVLGRNPGFLHGDDRDQPEIEKIRAAIREQREGHAVLRNYHKDGTLYWNDLHIAPVLDNSGKVTHFVGVQNDITESKRYQEELEHQANHDTLTGLANRNLLDDRLQQAMVYSQRYGRLLAVGFIDLDDFKFINDSLGHNIGDQLLKNVAKRLKTCVREGDTVTRLGGDEFVLILNDQEDVAGVSHLMERILEAIAQPMIIDGHDLYTSCSIGLSLYPQDGQDVETLLKNADVAMYRAKEQGRNDYQFHTMEMNTRLNERRLLEGSLRHALERSEFVLYYQPRVDLGTGQIVGMEALIRWQHPDLGLILPARFIPLAEETGLIIPIGEWVFRTACAQNKAWQDAGLPAVIVSVNLSARQFRQKDLGKILSRILAETGLDAQYLELELTESLVMHNAEEFIDAMIGLKALGMHISIDDFGTGYSSLSYLKRFPIDRLKLDRSFVRDILSDPNDAVISQTVIVLAHSLNLKVTAEGVETAEQAAFLRAHHCDEVQGFYFGRPVPADEFMRLLRT